MITIKLGGVEYEARPPASFAEREDIVDAWREAGDSAQSRRVFAATVALCTPAIAKLVKPADDFKDLPAYGKAVHDHLRGQGVKADEIARVALDSLWQPILDSLYPRAVEVQEAVDFIKTEASPT